MSQAKNNFFKGNALNTEELKNKYANNPSEFLLLNNMQIHYRDEGPKDAKQVILLLHGFGAHLYTFDRWSKILCKDHRIIRLDLPGFGFTDPFEDGDYQIRNYTAFLDLFLNELGIKKCVIGGNSMGGCLAWNYTLDYPHMVEKLILIDAAGHKISNRKLLMLAQIARLPNIESLLRQYTPDTVIEKSIAEIYADPSRMDKEHIIRYTDLFRKQGSTKAMVDISKTLEMIKYKIDPRIEDVSRIEQPTLIMWGDKDKILPVKDAKSFHEKISNSKMVILENSGHVPMEEIPEESIAPILDFLAE